MFNLFRIDRNHLLGSLLEAGGEDLRSHLEFMPLAFGDVLYEAGSKLADVYFPTSSIVSFLLVMEDGAADEIAFVGSEGIVGVPLFLGAAKSPHRVVVRSKGYAFRLNGQLLLQEFNRSGAMQNCLLRYTQALLTQIAQTVVCHRHHSIHQQFCRWLLASVDRLPSDELSLTQESIAGMLGVRRETISKEVGVLQAAGLIQSSRGKIAVIDRPRLEARACECYHGMKTELDRLSDAPSAFHPRNGRPAASYMPLPRVAMRAQHAAPAHA